MRPPGKHAGSGVDARGQELHGFVTIQLERQLKRRLGEAKGEVRRHRHPARAAALGQEDDPQRLRLLPDWSAPRYQAWPLLAREHLNPGSPGGAVYRLALQPPFNTVSEFRDPGRVNVNTVRRFNHRHLRGPALRKQVFDALWGGEEQGLLGSRAYVTQHFADRAGCTE